MTYLRARRNDLTSLFWADLAEDLDVNRARRADVPNAIDELARGDISVVCDPQDAEAALAWARAQPYWPRGLGPEHDPLYVVDSNAAQLWRSGPVTGAAPGRATHELTPSPPVPITPGTGSRRPTG